LNIACWFVLKGRLHKSNSWYRWTFRWADCDTNHCLVGAEVKEGCSVCKWTKEKLGVERFYLEMLNSVEV